MDVDKGWRIHKWEPTEGQSSKPRPQGRRGPLRSVKSLLLKFHRSLFQLPSHTCLSLTSAALPTLGPCHAVPAFSDDGGLLRTQADCLREAGEVRACDERKTRVGARRAKDEGTEFVAVAFSSVTRSNAENTQPDRRSA